MNTAINQNNMPVPELVRPIYFRTKDQYLYGCHHLPGIKGKIQGAVVLCSASGYEYYCSHRGVKQLATQLAKAGFHVLRFDYVGTGDSAGTDESATFAQWVLDVASAIDELKKLSHCDRVSIIGLRLGAVVVSQAIKERSDIDRIVLWNPVLTGQELLQQWSTVHSEHYRQLGYASESSQLKEVMGISLSSEFTDELQQIKLAPVQAKESETLVLMNQENECTSVFVNDMKKDGSNVQLKVIEDPDVWKKSDEGIVPSASLNNILQWLEVDHD